MAWFVTNVARYYKTQTIQSQVLNRDVLVFFPSRNPPSQKISSRVKWISHKFLHKVLVKLLLYECKVPFWASKFHGANLTASRKCSRDSCCLSKACNKLAAICKQINRSFTSSSLQPYFLNKCIPGNSRMPLCINLDFDFLTDRHNWTRKLIQLALIQLEEDALSYNKAHGSAVGWFTLSTVEITIQWIRLNKTRIHYLSNYDQV